MRTLDALFLMGLIPAYAGSTVLRSSLRGGLRAHPRLRGEHVLVAGF